MVIKGNTISFNALYNAIPPDPESMVTDFWKEKIAEITRDFLPQPPPNFLQQGTIVYTMFAATVHPQEVEFLQKHLGKRDAAIHLEEDAYGQASTVRAAYADTSGNRIHHLYHFIRYQEETGSIPHNVFEFGGGYCGMARLHRRFCGPDSTYIVTDLRILSCLQYDYLSTILGAEAVNIITTKGQAIEPGKINIVPLSLLDSTKGVEAELFLSTWGISEAPKTVQDYVIEKNLFGAKKVLMARQGTCGPFPAAGDIENMVDGGKSIEIDFLPGNFYFFK